MKYLKRIGIILFLIVITITILFICKVAPLLGSDGVFMPSTTKIEHLLKTNCDQLSYVSKYMLELQYSFVRWDATERDKLTYYYEQNNGGIGKGVVEIDDPMLSENMNKLQNAKFEHIIKENNYIMFVKWSSLDSSCGLVYCQDDRPNMNGNGEISIKELGLNHWYYYKFMAN